MPVGDNYLLSNPFFDAYANYTVYGIWNFINPPIISDGWLTAGNTLASNGILGTLNAVGFSIITNNTPVMAFDESGNVTITSGAWLLTAAGDVTEDGPSITLGPTICTTFSAGNDACDVNIVGAEVDLGAVGNVALNAQNNVNLQANNDINLQPMGYLSALANSFVIQGNTDSQITTTDGNMVIEVNGSTNDLTLTSADSEVYINGATQVVATTPSFTVAAADIFFTGLNPGSTTQVLYYDNTNGQVTWGASPGGGGSDWSLTGNAGLTSGNFLGSTDTSTLQLATNSTVFMSVDGAQNAILNPASFDLTAPGAITVTTTTNDLTLQSFSGSIEINATNPGQFIYFSADSISSVSTQDTGFASVSGNVTFAANNTNTQQIDFDAGGITFTVDLTCALSCTDFNLSASDSVSIDATNNIEIGTTTATQVNFGNANTVSTLVGTQWEVQTTTSVIEDAPTIQIGVSTNTTMAIGNINTVLFLDSAQTTIFGQTYVDIDSATEVQIGQSDATIIQIGNSGTSTLTIIGGLPGSPPVGSVPVMWDPVSKQFYHT